ncbi:hypothetical protein ACPZ19_50735 [Amycolatopsis lurida]
MLFPHTESRRVVLRPAGDKNVHEIYEMMFRLGSPGLPMLDEFANDFGAGFSACFLIQCKDVGETVGFSTLGELALAGHIRAEVNLLPGYDEQTKLEADVLTTNFAFAMWRTRKVHFQVTDAMAGPSFGNDPDVAREEAVLPEYKYLYGKLWDLHVIAVDREKWDTYGVNLLKQIL